ncbi:ferritin-like domain-containing protein [Corallococcus exiguus]|uniref:ferritin-like domain-containing protein n=1 Tax=Corallococcus TaxID=83461 RepID=UPI000EC29E7D|nr:MULTISPECIES: ferritin-like domain-containing protein [Corallococcus]NRD53038.1 ferritin-like domain-containing protein [Corallococcus exiguus]NRD62935.1 ferritin-like domain-containing protein [Corallococcus exiguus]RKI13644.1 ferritin-like domain-containing protein [Corallococcus sp. AB030]RUO89099.1 ferritin-like domain-containing protein [Corallococcus sp. AB018]
MSSGEGGDWGLKHTAAQLTAEELEQVAREEPPRDSALPPSGSAVRFLRVHLMRIAGHLGELQPPDFRELVGQALQTAEGPTPLLFVAQLRERLAFERTSSRLYAGLLVKTHALGSYPGGPTPERLVELHNQELDHLNLIRECIYRLGVDASQLTAQGDGADPRPHGLLRAVDDPCATLPDALRAVLIAEILNNAGWAMLVDLAQELGPPDLVDAFREVLREETLHLEEVTTWVANLPDDVRVTDARASAS